MPPSGLPSPRRSAAVKAMLARSFEGYLHPQRDILLGMRRAAIVYGLMPSDVLTSWVEGWQSPALKRLPVPGISQAEAAMFHRLRAEEEVIPEAASEHERRARNHLQAALHVLAMQAVDPWWNGPRLAGIQLPNQMDWEFLGNPDTAFHNACWSARSNPSYLIATADEDRIPDFAVARDDRFAGISSPVSREVAQRLMSAGGTLEHALNDALGENPDPHAKADVMADLERVGLVDLRHAPGLTRR